MIGVFRENLRCGEQMERQTDPPADGDMSGTGVGARSRRASRTRAVGGRELVVEGRHRCVERAAIEVGSGARFIPEKALFSAVKSVYVLRYFDLLVPLLLFIGSLSQLGGQA